ncbi:MAG: SemiSWEET transporter [Candidatus Koribacter versatilis]|uniref:SemiSWEET transporter n=1 Tax=Candidatus Korobacter versatilis TaxID=658062 RepID=A0A932A8J0_9BACT|nr:SemiSWEET transporter [Candidatus Koribacter versatilis]
MNEHLFSEHAITLIGFVAGTLTTLSFVPQVLHTWKTKRCDDLSFGMLLAFGLGVALWLVYGIALRAMPIIAANSVTLVLIAAIAAMKRRFAPPGY